MQLFLVLFLYFCTLYCIYIYSNIVVFFNPQIGNSLIRVLCFLAKLSDFCLSRYLAQIYGIAAYCFTCIAYRCLPFYVIE